MVTHTPVQVDGAAFLTARIDAVSAIAPMMIAMDFLGSAMMAALFWDSGRGWAGPWVIASAIVIAGRIMMLSGYRLGKLPVDRWARWLSGLAFASGMLWGAALGVVVATGSDNQVMFAVCVALSGLTLSIAHVAYWPLYAWFAFPIMLGAASGFAVAGRPWHWLLASAAAIMAFVLLGVSRRLSNQILGAFRLAAANQALVDSLGERGRELEMACAALERVSRTDPLTGLANRRSRDTRLAEEWNRALRSGGSLAVIAIDVDRFKRFNDTHGHDEGDRALQAVAAMLEAGVRVPIDLAARHGGEEFMLILPGVDLAGAASIAERVRVMVAKCHADPACGLPEKITVSLGVAAMIPAAGRSLHELTIAADAALYQAKLAGRNRYELGVIEAVPAAA